MPTCELRTIGHVDLVDEDGHEVLAVLSQPKRLALLSYLAIAGARGFVRRDTLVATFWPDHNHDRARANLRNALSALRASLGDGVIVTRGAEEVGVDPARLRCDVVALRDAVERGNHDAVRQLTRGEFLTGFHLQGASWTWEEWVEDIRREVKAYEGHASEAATTEIAAAPRAAATVDSGRSRRPWTASALGVLLAIVGITVASIAIIQYRVTSARDALARMSVVHILWVDDNPENNVDVVIRFRELGMQVTTALNTAEAVARYDPNEFQLVISDMGRYEGADDAYVPQAGLDLLSRLKAVNDSVRVVICTSPRAVAAHGDEAMEAGAADVVSTCADILPMLGF